MAALAPAWRPSEPHTLAWAATDGTVTVEDADTAKVLRTYRGGSVRRLAWSGDGRRLLIAGRRDGTIHDLATGKRDAGCALAAASSCSPPPTRPKGNRLALAVYSGGRTEIRVRDEILRSSPAGSTTSSGPPTAAGCWRAGPPRASG